MVGEWLWQNMSVAHHGFPITFGAISGLMILIGIRQLFLLIRDHPPQPYEANPEKLNG
jgi:hypothetical protein